MRNGKDTFFLLDVWFEEEALICSAIQDINIVEKFQVVSDYWDIHRG